MLKLYLGYLKIIRKLNSKNICIKYYFAYK